jgi:TetR/AcrR family transcriptional regulator
MTTDPRNSPRPGRPVADPGRDARALLLSAASQLIAEQGVAATTFVNIAKRAGFTPAMMHYYFRDRDELLDALVAERILPFFKYVWEPVQPGDDAAELVRGIIRRLVDAVEREPWVPNTWMREVLNESGLLRQRVLRHIPVEKVRIVGEEIRAGQHKGSLNPDLHPLLSVFSAIGLVMFHLATAKIWSELYRRPALSAEEMRRHITALMLDGLNHAPRSPRTTKPSKASRRNP